MNDHAVVNAELELYRSIFNLSMVGAAHVALEGLRIEWANGAFGAILGYSAEEVIGHSLIDFAHPDHLPEIRKNVVRMAEGNSSTLSVDRQLLHKNGSYVWANVTATLKRREDGQPTHVVAMLQDITERKRQELELRKSEMRLNATLGAIQDVVWSFSVPDYQMLYMNPAATKRIYGREPEEFYKNTGIWQEIVHPDDLPLVGGIEKRLLEFGVTEDEFRIIWPSGEVRWLQAHAWLTKAEDGSPARFEGVTRDITESKNAEIALRESEARLRLVMEAGKIGLWEMNTITYDVTWSAVLRELLGVSDDFPATSDAFANFVHPGDREAYAQSAAGLREKNQYVFPPFRIVRPDGNIRWLQNVGRVVKVGDQLRGAIVDVTDARETEILFEKQKAKMVAASKMSALGEMAGGMAHEINNPVAIIHGNAMLLKDLSERGEMDPKLMKQATERIERTAKRITSITRALLAFARDAEQDPFEEVPLQSVVEETVEFCRERFRLHGIELMIGKIYPSLRVECRPTQISQVLLNLLNNAHDAVEGLPHRWIQIAATERENQVELSVTDSGSGIPPELRERIFEPFFTTKEVGKGTGLGLSVASGIIESHHGRLYIDSSHEHTRFLVNLPKRRN